jgi:hypothetical protein
VAEEGGMNAGWLERLRALLATHQLQHREAEIAPLVQPSLRLTPQAREEWIPGPRRLWGLLPGAATRVVRRPAWPPGRSRLGGVPHVPPGFVWPRWHDRPLGFIGQIRCDEIPPDTLPLPFPSTGLLYFFYDFIAQEWAPQIGEAECAPAVWYAAETTSLVAAPLPTDRPAKELVLPEVAVTLVPQPTLPATDTVQVERLGFSEAEAEAYGETRIGLLTADPAGGPVHQLGGLAHPVQGDVLTEVAAYAQNQQPGREQRARAAQLAADWQLLLQVDTDALLDVMWGDAGTIYFVLRREDLVAGRFGRTQVVLQCG